MYLNIVLLLDWKNTINVSDIAVYDIFTERHNEPPSKIYLFL